MKAWELLLSESQERMLLVVQKGKEDKVQRIFEKWDLPCSVIGEVTDDKILHFYMNDELQAAIPAEELVLGGGAPQYEREYRKPHYFDQINKFNPDAIAVPDDLKYTAEQIVQIPSIASKKWIFMQYDSMVGTVNSSTNAPADAATVIVKGTKKALTVTTDCNSRYVFADPYTGAMIAVSEAARNIVCSGGVPLGVTNCLNFGNPYDPEVYYQFVEVIKGMGEACRKFDTPVTGGNVSFYNQNPDGAIFPTPTIGMVGLLENVNNRMTLDFKSAGDIIFVIGTNHSDISSSEYLNKIHGVEFSPAPYFNLEEESELQTKVSELITNRIIESAHDVSEGGQFIALLESSFNRNLGFDVVAADYNIRKDAYWFGESQSRIIVTVKTEKVEGFKLLLNGHPYEELGIVTGGSIEIDGMDWGRVRYWKDLYETAIEKHLSKVIADGEGALSVI
jgi:phosphoribosylformylglycinamidine synthase